MGCDIKTVDKVKRLNSRFPTCKLTQTLTSEVDSLAAYDNNRILIGAKGELQLFNISQKSITTISKDHTSRINAILKLSTGNVVTAGQDGTIKLWDIDNKKCIGDLKGHTAQCWVINEIQGNKLISGGDDKECKIWDLLAKKEDFTLYKGPKAISAAIQLKDGKVLISSGKLLLLFDINTKEQLTCQDLKGGAWTLHQMSNGEIIAGEAKGIVALVTITDEIIIKATFKTYFSRTVTLCIELDNLRLVAGSDANDLVLYDFNDLDSMFIMGGHTDAVSAICKINGGSFATAAKDGKLKIWE